MKIEIVPAIHELLNVNIYSQNDIFFGSLFFFYSNFFLSSFLLELEGYQQNKFRRLSNGFFRKQSERKEKKKIHISPFPPNWFKATIYKTHIFLIL